MYCSDQFCSLTRPGGCHEQFQKASNSTQHRPMARPRARMHRTTSGSATGSANRSAKSDSRVQPALQPSSRPSSSTSTQQPKKIPGAHQQQLCGAQQKGRVVGVLSLRSRCVTSRPRHLTRLEQARKDLRLQYRHTPTMWQAARPHGQPVLVLTMCRERQVPAAANSSAK